MYFNAFYIEGANIDYFFELTNCKLGFLFKLLQVNSELSRYINLLAFLSFYVRK